MAEREDLIQAAVKFLQDPKVQEAPIAKRTAFLESKGLTAAEIKVATDRASETPPPVPASITIKEQYSWKDVALAFMGVIGVGYGIGYLATYYFIDYPTAAKVEKDTDAIEKQLEGSSKTLELITTQTKDIIKGMESHSNDVSEALNQMHLLLNKLKEADDSRNEEIRSIKQDVDELKATFPKVSIFNQLVEKNKESESAILTELQTEIKSLKNLLMNRRIPVNVGSKDEDGHVSIVENTFAGIKFGKPAIPAWQLAAQDPVPVEESNFDEGKSEHESDTDSVIHLNKSQEGVEAK